jgi:hypothetical protein
MEASLDAGVSQRYLSFIEIGCSVPSRETLIGIAEALEIPYWDRNSLLLAAGYAPMYEDAGWNDQDMRSVTMALNRMLKQHEPYPALGRAGPLPCQASRTGTSSPYKMPAGPIVFRIWSRRGSLADMA